MMAWYTVQKKYSPRVEFVVFGKQKALQQKRFSERITGEKYFINKVGQTTIKIALQLYYRG